MKKHWYKILILLTCGICDGQNLVPNGDFEMYSTCPTGYSQITSALNWFNPAVFPGAGGSPDYYNQCAALNSYVNVPNMVSGYQFAHSGGAFAGIGLWYSWGLAREYIEVNLTSTLIANSCYHFEMYVNLADICKYTTNNIGVYFSDTLIGGINNAINLPFIPQINNISGNNPDTLNWILITGDYNAIGGENFLIIGNFENNLNTDTIMINNSGNPTQVYFYIDDVSLTICTGINELNEEDFDIYPNPVKNELNVHIANNELTEIILYDITSKKVLEQKFKNSAVLNTSQLSSGMYLYELRCNNIVIRKGKIVKD